MTFRNRIGAALACLLFASAPMAAVSAEATTDRQAVEKIIKEYLLSNPDVLLEALTNAQQWQENKKMSDNADALFRSPNTFVAGNPKGDIALVEFFDYNCGYCKRAMGDVLAYMESDPNVRVIMREFPILGPGSLLASQAAIASRKQGKYWEFHLALLQSKGIQNEDQVMKIASEVGLDVEQLKRDMQDESVTATIQEGYQLAEALGIRGTPTFVLGERIVPNAENLLEVLASTAGEIRESGGCKIC